MDLDAIRFEEPINGYSPREDSWLLANAIPSVSGKKCMDMGCGSGIQTASLLKNNAKSVTCVDRNPNALNTTGKMVEKYFPDATIHYIESFLFENVKGRFDVIVFNPPYVPSDDIKWIETDGGKKGREIIDAFLDQLSKHLNPGGECYLLQTSLNGVTTTQTKLTKLGLKGIVVARKKISFEELLVWKITHA